jgi:putative toxin-antitoxin system antitoxin component (TIGR02293 family)
MEKNRQKSFYFRQKSYICINIYEMKKNKLYTQEEKEMQIVQETTAFYGTSVGFTSIDDRSVFAIIDSINKGISFTAFENIIKKYSFTLQNWAEFLHISNKTLSRYQKESKTFDALQSERIMQIEILHSKGEEVFGSRENFSTWLETENLALGNIIPRDLLKNSFGINLLMDELVRIEHGVLA